MPQQRRIKSAEVCQYATIPTRLTRQEQPGRQKPYLPIQKHRAETPPPCSIVLRANIIQSQRRETSSSITIIRKQESQQLEPEYPEQLAEHVKK